MQAQNWLHLSLTSVMHAVQVRMQAAAAATANPAQPGCLREIMWVDKA